MRDRTRDGFLNRLEAYGLSHGPRIWRAVMAIPPLRKSANKFIISRAAKRTESRPYQFSTMSDYTSWASLTDQGYYSRHLPARKLRTLPSLGQECDPLDLGEMRELFEVRGTKPIVSETSTVLFMSFAQWFTDGFLISDPCNLRRTFTTHQIDLSPVYGLCCSETNALRLKSEERDKKGRMKTEDVNDGTFAPRLFDDTKLLPKDLADENFDERRAFKSQFASLRQKLASFNKTRQRLIKEHGPEAAAKRAAELARTTFAFGGERANITPFTAALNTLFLREHNRLAGILEGANQDWDDERVFQTARNINIVLLIKIVVEEYINHISPYHFQLSADPSVAWRAVWNRPNWIPLEFNLLYRWHSMTPEQFDIADQAKPVKECLQDNSYLTKLGLAETLARASRQHCWELGLFNTAKFLLPVEKATIKQSRANQIGSYNDYREAFQYPRVTKFEQITADQEKIKVLKSLYRDVDNIEFYVGLLAEDISPRAALPPLIGRMVAFDAFSHALTNPLLSKQVFNERTFTKIGMDTINATCTLQDILDRNLAPKEGRTEISMTHQQRPAALA